MAISKEKEQEYRDWAESDKQRAVDEDYGGDEEKYYASIRYGRREVVLWDEIKAYAQVLPLHEELAQKFIIAHLGYLPRPCIYLRHEVYIRAIIEDYNNAKITQDQFHAALVENIKHIRNADMEQEGWANDIIVTDKSLAYYDTHLVQFKEQAKNRITRFLGYEPPLIDSLHAELVIRDLFAQDWFHDNMPILETDYKMLHVISYRYIFRHHGKDAADASALPRFE